MMNSTEHLKKVFTYKWKWIMQILFQESHLSILLEDCTNIKFPPLHPFDDREIQIRSKRERIRTFYTINAQSIKEAWSKQRITNISGCRMLVVNKFGLNCMLDPLCQCNL